MSETSKPVISIDTNLRTPHDELVRTLQPVGDDYFDSSRAWRNDAVIIFVAVVAASLAGLSLTLEYRRAGSTTATIGLTLLGSLVSASLVACWATYVRIGLEQIRRGAVGALNIDWTQPLMLRQRVRATPTADRLNPRMTPVAWHSPLATTLWRLRLAFVVILGGFSWSIFATGAAVATHVLTWAPIVFLAFGSIISLCHFVPFVLIDNARRRFRDADIDVVRESSTSLRPVRIVALIIGCILLVLSVVQLAQRAIPLVEDSTPLKGQSTTNVELTRSTQTFYAGCNDDVVCSRLGPSEITVISVSTHARLTITDDQGVDHESFDGHPWLSVANVSVPLTGHYLVTLGGSARGRYSMALSQSAIFRAVLPLIGAVIWRVIALWLTGVAIYETAYFRRIRRNMYLKSSTS